MGNPSTAPATTLEGRIASIVGPLVIEIAALAFFVESAALVAVTVIAFGEGAAAGAVYIPLALIVPHVAPLHPAPVTALATLQVTVLLVELVTVA
jgi:hypothetical protein